MTGGFDYPDAFRRGWVYQSLVADILRLHWGIHDIEENTQKKIVRYQDRDEMVDEWDLALHGQTIEVKALDKHFTHDIETFPYPSPFIMTQYSWDSVKQKPIMVILISQKTEHMLGIDTVATRDKWKISKPFWDKKRKLIDKCYQLPKSNLLTVEQIAEKLQSITPQL